MGVTMPEVSFGAELSRVTVSEQHYLGSLANWLSTMDVASSQPDSTSRSRHGTRDYIKVEVEVRSAIFMLPSYYVTAWGFSTEKASARRPARRDPRWQVSRGRVWEPSSREHGPGELTFSVALVYAKRCVFRDYARLLVRSGLQSRLSLWGQVFLARELGLLIPEDGSDWNAQITPSVKAALMIGGGLSVSMQTDNVYLTAGANTFTITPAQPNLAAANSEITDLTNIFWALLRERGATTDQRRLEQRS